MNILVTGANGFVGNALMQKLLKEGHQITALIRSNKIPKKNDRIKWIYGDLLVPEKLPELTDIDKAYYLVHGLKSDEKEFEYLEALAAVNFINWIRPTKAGIIYLGGLGPHKEKLSPHLRSRHLTGAILGASGLSVIEFRASIILGEGSLSFEMIKALTERFPLRPKMPLLNQSCQPLALSDLLDYLVSALNLSNTAHEIFEIGGPQAITYGELLDLYAKLSGLKRPRVKVPELDTRVLMRTLEYAIPEYSQIGKKLTESLEHPTIVTNNRALNFFPSIKPIPLHEAMEEARKNSTTIYSPVWEKDFLKVLLSDKILTESGPLPSELLRKLDKLEKLSRWGREFLRR
jgi:uncharacterized protein YbjT (DUF2867 family)